MSIENGGNAFPTPHLVQPGMTLRDYFAAQAMAICPLAVQGDKAEWCYRMADAMLKARGEK